jgi:hypothetical protein
MKTLPVAAAFDRCAVRAWCTVLVLALPVPALAQQVTCAAIASQAEKGQSHFYPRLGFKVAGKGRLYFHAAPDGNCRSKDVFVILGDGLIAYSEYKGWFSVMYFNHKTREDFEGWVDRKRLKFIGTEGPNY